MLNYAETASISTNVSLLPVSSTSDERETGPLPSLTGFENLVPLRIGNIPFAKVSPTLKDGYLAACKVYHEMEETTEYGPYFLLTGYKYAHLTRQYIPHNLSSVDKREWHRGFIVGWNACTFGLETEEQAYEAE